MFLSGDCGLAGKGVPALQHRLAGMGIPALQQGVTGVAMPAVQQRRMNAQTY